MVEPIVPRDTIRELAWAAADAGRNLHEEDVNPYPMGTAAATGATGAASPAAEAAGATRAAGAVAAREAVPALRWPLAVGAGAVASAGLATSG